MKLYFFSLFSIAAVSLYSSCSADSNQRNGLSSSQSPTIIHGKIDYVYSTLTAAGISVSSIKLPSVIKKIRKGSPAYFGGLLVGDKIISITIDKNKLSVIVERKDVRFSTQFNTAPVAIADNVQMDKDAVLEEHMLKGEPLFNELADNWLKLYDKPDDPKLSEEVRRLGLEVQKRVIANGGHWYINQPYLSNERDPRFLLCEGTRLYAVGDLRNAVKLFEEVAALSHDSQTVADALYNIAAICETQKKFELAATYYQKAHEKLPSDPEINKAIETVGKVPVLYEGGIFEIAKSKASFATGIEKIDTCPRCRVARNSIMNGG